MKRKLDVISKIVEFIEDHLMDDLDLDKIANVAGYSKYHLHRMFTNTMGLTIHQYIQKRRLTKAAWELVNTNKAIIDIAFNIGYETQQSFTLAFKKLYNESPQVYRRKNEFYPLQRRKVINIGKVQPRSSYVKNSINCEVKAA